MTFTVRMLDDAPALLLTLSSQYNLFEDFPRSYAAVTELLDSAEQPVYYILDLTDVPFDMTTIIQGAANTSRDTQGTFHHPNVRAVLLISPHEVIHFAAQGLREEVYGQVTAQTFYTLDDALAYMRTHA
jgi:hypothetical protein